MKKTISILSTVLVMSMMFSSVAFAEEETVFSGNVRLHYNKLYNDANKEWNEDFFGLHYLELVVRKQVGAMGVYVNERIGDNNANYLYEGWASLKFPCIFGLKGSRMIKLGLVPVPFGIFANGLYFPKGIPYDKNWMWEYDYGASFEATEKLGEALSVDLAVAYLSRENSAGELGAFSAGDCPVCIGERDTISGRLGVDLNLGGALGVKAGGSAQLGKLMREGQEEKDDKLGIAGDVTITPKMIPIPVSVLAEFINYSLADIDAAKGNILMAQLDVTPLQNIGPLNKAILSLHLGMDMSKDENVASKTNLIGQLRLIMYKQFNIFAQVFADKIEEVDEMKNKGMRIWFMYVF